MRIILDPQIFNIQTFGGISRYYTEIFTRIKQYQNVDIIFPLYETNNVYLSSSNLIPKNNQFLFRFLNFLPKIGISTRSITKKKTQKIFSKTIQNKDFDLFVPTYYYPYFLENIVDKPFVLTVYDMIHEIFPQYFLDDLETKKNKKLLINKATKIIAISENTKFDILKFYPEIDSSKIEVVYLSHSITSNIFKKIEVPENYILFVGNRSIYKNFNFFIKAVTPILYNNPKLFVVAAGGNKFNTEELKLLKYLKILSQVIQTNFEEQELAAYYYNAKCFVFPSEYEGFGIPVLEAMASKCPVVLANHSSFPEVAGDAGVYFELNDELDLRNKINLLLENDNLRNEYINKGIEQVNKFSWQKTADECLKVYQKAILC